MSPNTQVALIALILFFAVATVSIFWPRLTKLKRSSMKLASGVRPATVKVPRSAPELQDRPLSPHLQTDRWTGVAYASHHRRRAVPWHCFSLGVLAAQHGPGTALLRLAPRSYDPVRLHLGSDAVPSAVSKDMLVEQFQVFASEVLVHPVHELVSR